MTGAVIIGERSDPHVVAVLERMSADALVLDAQSLRCRPFVMDERGLSFDSTHSAPAVGRLSPVRGWVRRVVPDSWLRSVRADSREAAEASAWTTLLAALLQLENLTWLTRIGPITRSENKLTQADTARALGLRTPRTIVTNDISYLRDAFSGEVVVKPLGAGHFIEQGRAFTVHAAAVQTERLTSAELAVAPFLIQEKLHAERHWRVVTVAGEVWSAALDARGVSLDWRRDSVAHSSFVDVPAPPAIEQGALAVAGALDLGYSSQDWIETADDVYVIDINPSGQWLFLPEHVGAAVASAIARWLENGNA